MVGTIKLLTSLPVLKRTAILDATQVETYTGQPVVEIDAQGLTGLVLDKGSNQSQVRGLSLTNSGTAGLTIKSCQNIVVDNYIGLDLQGLAKPNAVGIKICHCVNNQIGLNPKNISGWASNVISGNIKQGILLCKTSYNNIVSNFIGTDPSGQFKIPNGQDGILITKKSDFNTIGGTIYTNSEGITNNPTGDKGQSPIVYIFPPLGNLIAGNIANGVKIVASKSNVLNGNFIGFNINTQSDLGNGGNGVYILEADNNILRGCTFTENPFVYYNVCSGNYLNGLQISNSNNTIVQGNFFGIDASNAHLKANGQNGILVDGTSTNTQVGGVIPLGNVCSGNNINGIQVSDTASSFISFNTFGGLYAFYGAAPNNQHGIYIDSTGLNNIVRTCVFSGNLGSGIYLTGNGQKITIESVICGLDTKGNEPLANGQNGLTIAGRSANNLIGTNVASVIPRSAFAGNLGQGIYITDLANNNTINLAFIGLSVAGENLNCQNKQNGILIDAQAYNNFIGTTETEYQKLTNYMSANEGYGFKLNQEAKNNQLIANYIGYTFEGQIAKNVLGAYDNLATQPNTISNNIIAP